MHYKAKAVLTLMWKKCFIYPFPHLLFSLWSFLFDGEYTKCLGLITMSLLYWQFAVRSNTFRYYFRRWAQYDVNSFFWWRIDFWTNYFGVSSQTTLSLFSQKSDFITGLHKPAMLAYSLLHVVSLWWLSCYIVLLSRSLKVIWLPVVTSCVGSLAVTRPFDGGEVSLHVPGKYSVF